MSWFGSNITWWWYLYFYIQRKVLNLSKNTSVNFPKNSYHSYIYTRQACNLGQGLGFFTLDGHALIICLYIFLMTNACALCSNYMPFLVYYSNLMCILCNFELLWGTTFKSWVFHLWCVSQHESDIILKNIIWLLFPRPFFIPSPAYCTRDHCFRGQQHRWRQGTRYTKVEHSKLWAFTRYPTMKVYEFRGISTVLFIMK